MWLDVLHEKHYKALYGFTREAEAYDKNCPYEQFAAQLKKREGFVVVAKNGELAGCVTFSDYVPGVNIMIHCTVADKYQKRWVTRGILKRVSEYVYDELGLGRMTGFCVPGKSDKAGAFLLSLGFKHEGTIRQGVKLPDGFFDLELFGMLRSECRWL